MFEKFMQKIVRALDPKLEKFRPIKPAKKPEPFTPKTLTDFIEVIRRTPKSVLSSKDRDRIAAVMNFESKTVRHLMVDKSKMIFVHKDEVLGPLILDKLYKSGFTNFPVVDDKEKVIGVIHTEALNTLEIKKTDHASKYLDKNINYLSIDDSLPHVVKEIERTNSYYFLVRDNTGDTVGFFTTQMLLDYLLES